VAPRGSGDVDIRNAFAGSSVAIARARGRSSARARASDFVRRD
jgi:hypothetical protein